MGSSPSRVKGKTVLLTGASRGIGLATALLLAEEGWIVFAGVRKQEDFDKLQQSHANIRPVFLDVTKPEQIASAVETVRTAVGDSGLDALVNNAGGAHMTPAEFMPPEDFIDEFQVNVFGVFRLTQAAIPLLRLGSPGRIVNVSSFLGRGTVPFGSAYCATKHALEAFSSILRQELKSSGIQVSVLAPGPVTSDFSKTTKERHARIAQQLEESVVYQQVYGKRMQKAYDIEDKNHKLFVAAELVANQIRKMLVTSWLRHRYCDCYMTWIVTNIYTWLPPWITERLTSILFY